MQNVTALKTQLSPRIAGSETGAATKSRVAVLPGAAPVEPRLALLDPTKTGTQADFRPNKTRRKKWKI